MVREPVRKKCGQSLIWRRASCLGEKDKLTGRICVIVSWPYRGCCGKSLSALASARPMYRERVRAVAGLAGPARARSCRHVPLRLAALKEPLLAQVALAPEQTLAQLCQWVKAEHAIEVGPTTMGKTLARFGLTLKKRHCMPASKNAPMWLRRGQTGAPSNRRWQRPGGWCSLMKRGRQRTWPRRGAARPGASAAWGMRRLATGTLRRLSAR